MQDDTAPVAADIGPVAADIGPVAAGNGSERFDLTSARAAEQPIASGCAFARKHALVAALGVTTASTRKKEELRRALIRDHVVPIARIAKSELPDSPELEPLRMPKGRLTVQKLAGHATGMSQAATPFTDLFVASGRPADFAQLQTASAAMVNAVNQRTNAKGAVHGATVGVKRALSRGRKIVGVLDSFVNSALANDPVLLAAWEKIKRVQLFNGIPTPRSS